MISHDRDRLVIGIGIRIRIGVVVVDEIRIEEAARLTGYRVTRTF